MLKKAWMRNVEEDLNGLYRSVLPKVFRVDCC